MGSGRQLYFFAFGGFTSTTIQNAETGTTLPRQRPNPGRVLRALDHFEPRPDRLLQAASTRSEHQDVHPKPNNECSAAGGRDHRVDARGRRQGPLHAPREAPNLCAER
jgi:hypothetical protein